MDIVSLEEVSVALSASAVVANNAMAEARNISTIDLDLESCSEAERAHRHWHHGDATIHIEHTAAVVAV